MTKVGKPASFENSEERLSGSSADPSDNRAPSLPLGIAEKISLQFFYIPSAKYFARKSTAAFLD
jgi:hypothetical protein